MSRDFLNQFSLRSLPVFLALVMMGCTLPAKRGDLGNKDLDYYFQTSGAVEFFLPQLPNWANNSASAGCQRKKSIRYFDFNALKGSYNLNYAQLIHFQHSFNVEQEELTRTFGNHAHSPGEEEKLFYKISDKIRAGHTVFNTPNYPAINLIWIDHLLKRPPAEAASKLSALFQHPQIASAHPVWLSLCLTHHELSEWLAQAKLEGLNAQWITAEFFSAFDHNARPTFLLQFDVSAFFEHKKKINFYIPDTFQRPPEVKGDIQIRKLP